MRDIHRTRSLDVRFGFAITALVLSGILLILGIGQRTFLSGPREIVQQIEVSAETGFAVIPAAAFDIQQGQPNVVVTGPGAFAAVGHVRDVDAWVAPFAHDVVTVDPESRAVAVDLVQADPTAFESYETSLGLDEGAEVPLASPYASDLWVAHRGEAPVPDDADESADAAASEEAEESAQLTSPEEELSQIVRLAVDLTENQEVLVAVSADSAADSEVSISWVQDRRTPWAGPLLVAGGLFALLGGVLYLLAVDHDRRGLGPRRGRKGPLLGIRNSLSRSKKSPKKAVDNGRADNSAARSSEAVTPRRAERRSLRASVIPALGIVVALGLSGCSPSYWPDMNPSDDTADVQVAESNAAPVPITQLQIDRIIEDVVSISNAADAERDDAALSARFTNEALNQRVANYKVRGTVEDYEFIVPRITDEQLGYELVQSTETWPRTIFVTLASESGKAAVTSEEETSEPTDGTEPTEETPAETSPSLALILKQQNPHQNYQVTRIFSLRGGITMPEAAPVEEGTALLSSDLQTLALPPGEVGAAYAAVLTGGVEVEQAQSFDLNGDPLVDRVGAAWVAKAQQSADEAGQTVKYSVEIKPASAAVTSLSTGVGGALVAVTLTEERIGDSGGTRYGPTAVGAVTALSGLSGRQDLLVQVVTNQLLFFVPSKESGDPIQLLGFSSDLVGARNSK